MEFLDVTALFFIHKRLLFRRYIESIILTSKEELKRDVSISICCDAKTFVVCYLWPCLASRSVYQRLTLQCST